MMKSSQFMSCVSGTYVFCVTSCYLSLSWQAWNNDGDNISDMIVLYLVYRHNINSLLGSSIAVGILGQMCMMYNAIVEGSRWSQMMAKATRVSPDRTNSDEFEGYSALNEILADNKRNGMLKLQLCIDKKFTTAVQTDWLIITPQAQQHSI